MKQDIVVKEYCQLEQFLPHIVYSTDILYSMQQLYMAFRLLTLNFV